MADSPLLTPSRPMASFRSVEPFPVRHGTHGPFFCVHIRSADFCNGPKRITECCCCWHPAKAQHQTHSLDLVNYLLGKQGTTLDPDSYWLRLTAVANVYAFSLYWSPQEETSPLWQKKRWLFFHLVTSVTTGPSKLVQKSTALAVKLHLS